MASGRVNRTKRPNTWLHRPAKRREDSPCQLGAVHTWHFSDVQRSFVESPVLGWIRLQGRPRALVSAQRGGGTITFEGVDYELMGWAKPGPPEGRLRLRW